MATTKCHTISFALLLLLVAVLPSHASQYQYTEPEPVPVQPTYQKPPVVKPMRTYHTGKSLKPSYTQTPSPTTSLASVFLAGQNAARALVGQPPFTWNDKLAAYAQWWANQRVDDCQLIHSNGPYGENIFWSSGGDDSAPEVAVDAWVEERQYYDYYTNSCIDGQDCGHYTQIIWKGSTNLGCAKVTCNGGLGVFITCNYDPPGNYIGTRPY